MQKKEVSCMGYARKDVEKTKKIAKKFVRYQEGAELYSIGLTKLNNTEWKPLFSEFDYMECFDSGNVKL